MRNYNLLRSLVPEAHHSKNGFDRSSRELFSMKAGMLTPVKCVETVPDGYYEIDIAALARTLPMVSAPYTQMKLYFDTFFVPYSQLWHNWDSWRAQRDNYETSYHESYQYLPMLDMYNFATDILASWDTDNDSWKERDQQPQDAPFDLFGHLVAPNALRLAGLLGYGGIPGSPTTTKLLGWSERQFGRKLNLFRVAAYQKIFQDHYMNPYYQLPNPYYFNFDDLDCSTPQLATLSTQNAARGRNYTVPTGAPVGVPRVTAESQDAQPEVMLFTPRYRRWRQDLFMGLLPNPQFGEVSMMPGTDFTLTALNRAGATPTPVQTGDTLRVGSGQEVVVIPSGAGTSVKGTKFSIDNLISVLDERRAKALQKWKETTMRAGFRARTQAIAHDGIAPFTSRDDMVTFLGSTSQVISIDEVVAQSQTGSGENQQLGDVAGKGIMAMGSSSKIKFKATEFGVIMVIASIEPMTLYGDQGVSPMNQKVEQFDFFTQEFEQLGFAPVPESCLSGYRELGVSSIDNPVLGYAPRYWEYKTDFDRCHGEFEFSGSLAAWTIMRYDFSNPEGESEGMRIPDFYISPNIVDSIFGVNSTVDEYTDQFWITALFDVKAVQPMSVLGLPY